MPKGCQPSGFADITQTPVANDPNASRKSRVVKLIAFSKSKHKSADYTQGPPCRGIPYLGDATQRCAARVSLSRASTQRCPFSVVSFFQKGAWVFR